MIRLILHDFARRHRVWLGLTAAPCLLLGALVNDAELLFVAGWMLPAFGLYLFIHGRKQGCETSWLTLPVSRERLACGLWIGSAGCTLALFVMMALAMLLGTAWRGHLPHELDVYVPASLWILLGCHGWFHALWGLWPPSKLAWGDQTARQRAASLACMGALILAYMGQMGLPLLKHVAKSGVPWLVPMSIALALALLGRALFVRRMAGRMTFWDVAPPPVARPRPAPSRGGMGGFALLAREVVLGSLAVCFIMLLMVAIMRSRGIRTPQPQMIHESLVIVVLLFWSGLAQSLPPLANLRMLPLSTLQLALRLPLLAVLAFVLPLVVAVILDWTGYVPGLHQIALRWLPPLLATLLWAVVVALYCGTYSAGLIVPAYMVLMDFLLLALMPERWNSGTIPTRALVAGGLLLSVLAVLALVRVLGHNDAPYRLRSPQAEARPG